MYGLTRATLTLLGVAATGVLFWLATQVFPSDVSTASPRDYWLAFGLVAVGGLVMALSQLLGGWTKWGWPRVSGNVFLLAFLPTLVAGGWILAAGEPGDHWLGSHVRRWTTEIGIDGLVGDLTLLVPAVAFGVGLVFGLTFDTTGPRVRRPGKPIPAGAYEQPVADGDGATAEDRRVRIGESGTTAPPQPEPAPQSGKPKK